MRRWLLWLPLSVLTLLVVVSGVLLLARAQIAEVAARALLDRRGFPEAELTVATLTADRLEVTDVDLGPGAPKAARIAAVYTLGGLLDGRVDQLEIDGPRITVDMTASQPLGGVLQALPAGAPADAGPATAPRLPDTLPTVLLRNAAVELRDARTTVQMSLSGRIDRRAEETRGTLHGRVRTPHTTADVSLDARRLAREPRLFLEVAGESDLARLPWPDGLAHRPSTGRADFMLSGELQFPAPGQALSLDNLIRPASRLALELSVDGMDLPGLARGVSARTDLRLAVSNGALVARLIEPATLTTDGVETDRLRALGLPDAAAAMLGRFRTLALSPWTGGQELMEVHAVDQASPGAAAPAAWRWNGRASLQAAAARTDAAEVRVRAAADGTLDRGFGLQVARVDLLEAQARQLAYGPHRIDRASFDGRATAKPGGVTLDGVLEADGMSLSAGARRIDGVRLAAPIAVRHTPAGTRVSLSDAATIALPELPDTRPVLLDTPVALELTGLEATSAAGQLQASLTIDPGTLDATLLRQNAEDLAVSFTPGPISLALESLAPLQARVAFDGGTLAVPGERVRASEVSGEFKQGHGNPVALITLGHLTHGADPAALAPSLVWMQLHATGDQGWRVVGQQIVKGTDIRFPFAARTDADARNGEATLGPVDATFAKDGLQPGRVSPLLANRVRDVEGQLGMRGNIAWTPAGVTSSATLALTELSFAADAASVNGLTGTVFFDSLTPPDTPANQRLTANSVTAGVPLEDVEIVFDVDSADGQPVLRLSRAGGTLAEGEIYVRDAELRPGADTNRLTVQVRGISMGQLIGLLEVEGLRADGTLAGDIPLRLGPQGLRIDQGKLGAVDKGRIQVEFGAAQDTLASQGESVGLMVRALKDFRYDILSLTVTRPDSGDLALGITMQGSNPDVLDGYPFKFNINLSGDLEPILSALQTGRRLTTDLLQRALENRGMDNLDVQ